MRVGFVLVIFNLLFVLGCTSVPSVDPNTTPEANRNPSSLSDYRFPARGDFRLFFYRPYTFEFDPNQDLTKPLQNEGVADFLSSPIERSMARAFLPSISGAMGFLPEANRSQLDAMAKMGLDFLHQLRAEIRASPQEDLNKFLPTKMSSLLVPWQNLEDDLYHGESKISMDSGSGVFTSKLYGDSPEFEKKVSDFIQTYQHKMAVNPIGKVYPLAVLNTLKLNTLVVGSFNVKMLIGLTPMSEPFNQSDEMVQFEKLVIPSIPDPKYPTFPGNAPVVLVSFYFNIEEQWKDPLVEIQFGKFDRFEKGQFVLSETNSRFNEVPRLEGHLRKNWFQKVGVNLGIKSILMNLTTQKVSGVEGLVAPGVRIGNSNYAYFSIQKQDVNKTLTAELDKMVQSQIKDVRNKLGAYTSDEELEKKFMRPLQKKILERVFYHE